MLSIYTQQPSDYMIRILIIYGHAVELGAYMPLIANKESIQIQPTSALIYAPSV